MQAPEVAPKGHHLEVNTIFLSEKSEIFLFFLKDDQPGGRRRGRWPRPAWTSWPGARPSAPRPAAAPGPPALSAPAQPFAFVACFPREFYLLICQVFMSRPFPVPSVAEILTSLCTIKCCDLNMLPPHLLGFHIYEPSSSSWDQRKFRVRPLVPGHPAGQRTAILTVWTLYREDNMTKTCTKTKIR